MKCIHNFNVHINVVNITATESKLDETINVDERPYLNTCMSLSEWTHGFAPSSKYIGH